MVSYLTPFSMMSSSVITSRFFRFSEPSPLSVLAVLGSYARLKVRTLSTTGLQEWEGVHHKIDSGSPHHHN